MRIVIQRVAEAAVRIAGAVRGEIGHGLLVLVGVEDADTMEDVEWLAGKVARLRIFPDDARVMNRSVAESGGAVLVVSQFTLHASTKKGNRPSYLRASGAGHAVPLYGAFIAAVQREAGVPVRTGEFGAEMQVSLVNDGPVTLCLDSKARE